MARADKGKARGERRHQTLAVCLDGETHVVSPIEHGLKSAAGLRMTLWRMARRRGKRIETETLADGRVRVQACVGPEGRTTWAEAVGVAPAVAELAARIDTEASRLAREDVERARAEAPAARRCEALLDGETVCGRAPAEVFDVAMGMGTKRTRLALCASCWGAVRSKARRVEE